MLLFVLYKMKDIDEYSLLSELAYVLDKQNYFYKKEKRDLHLFTWLGYKDSNLDYNSQNVVCYHYTISQVPSYLLTYVICDKHFVLQIYIYKY